MPSWVEVKDTLKPFQVATAETAFDGLWREDTTSRFLVADEVGLGKTLVAKGVVARTIEHLRELGEKRIDIVYICSNQAIARQNLQKLTEFVEAAKDNVDELTHADRLTMLVASKGVKGAGVNIVGLTPGTSFTFGHRSGRFEERALLYTVLWKIWPLGREVLETPAGMRLFYYGIGEESLEAARDRLNEQFDVLEPRIGRAARDHVEALVKERNRQLRDAGEPDLYRQMRLLAPEYRKRMEPSREVNESRLALIGDLRQILAEAGVRMLQPDLVIMDEFQRFADLLDPKAATKSAELLRTFLGSAHPDNRAPTKVLLLSATPYRWFDRSGEGSHHTDFLTTLAFLNDGADEPVERASTLLKDVRDAVLANDAAAAQVAADAASAELRRVMCRTERLGSTDDRNGMLTEVVVDTGITEADVRGFLAAQELSDRLKSPPVVDLWKTAPWVPNLGDGYTLVENLDAACAVPPFEWGDRSLLDISRVADFQQLDVPNPRLRWLIGQTVGSGWYRLLWVPPTKPYYKVDNEFARLAEQGMTKQLVFSTWRVAPKAIALGVTYESEVPVQRPADGQERAPDSAGDDNDGMTEWANTAYRSHTRTMLELNESGDRLRLTNFMLFAPLLGLASVVDPLILGRGSRLSLDEVRDESRRVIDERLRLRGRDEHERTTEVDWYVAAARWFDQSSEWWSTAKPATFAGKDDKKEDGLRGCIDVFASPPQPAGTPPSDLSDVLVDLALGSPAICALRAMSRVLGAPMTDPRLVEAAARVAWGFRSYLNRPETINVVEHVIPEGDYWRRVLRYNAEGNLQAVLDEYFHMIREWKLGGLRGAERASKLADVAVEALSFRAVTLDVRVPSADGGSEKRKLRSRFSVRFGDRAGDNDGDRKDVTATAFNSPFWPFVMATTSIGQEGLDFHLYSHSLVHWNLPPDPVALEQREGRVHRYKGHAVRKNVAAASQNAGFDADLDIWDEMFHEAVRSIPVESYDGIKPFWVYDGDDRLANPAKVQRIVPVLPMSREVREIERLKSAAATYRMAFGQPRHDDLLQAVEGRADLPMIDLSPKRS